jgi:hypothetical protein
MVQSQLRRRQWTVRIGQCRTWRTARGRAEYLWLVETGSVWVRAVIEVILDMRTSAKSVPLAKLNAGWKNDLVRLLEGIFLFSEAQTEDGLVTRAESIDCRTILELIEKDSALAEANLFLALPKNDPLELLKLSCWTLLFLKSLFPKWQGAETWAQEVSKGPCKKIRLAGYVVVRICDPTANVLSFQVTRSKSNRYR